jgi:hypothetical protein
MSEFQKCPIGFVDIGGICVPKKRAVRKSLNYDSLFGRDSATHNVPVDIPDEPWDDTPTMDLDDQPMTPVIPDNPYQEEEDEYDQSQGLVDDDNRTPAERPVVPDHNVVVTNNEPLTEEQMEIDFIMDILFREQNNANLSEDQLQVLANANAEELLSVRQREQYISYISYLDGIGESPAIPSEPEEEEEELTAPEELDYQVIDDFYYRVDGESVSGGTAHLYDDQIIIYDSEGKRVAISSVTDYGGDRYLTVYNGEAVVYGGTSGHIQGMPGGGSVAHNDLIDENDSPPRGVDG